MDLQRYVSPDLTHFVGRGRTQEQQFTLLKKIIQQGVLQSRPRSQGITHGLYVQGKAVDEKLSSNIAYQGGSVCFCDIPVADLYLHMDKYSRFGIAFRKVFLAEAGVTPVMYVPERGRPGISHSPVPKDGLPLPKRGISSQAVAFDRFWNTFNEIHRSIEGVRKTHPKVAANLEKLVGFMDLGLLSHVKFFDHTLPDDHEHNFYMEREWRTVQDVGFDLADVQRIIIPSRFSRRLRNAFKSYDGEILFAD